MGSICLCGAMAGYPHKQDCPYPCFRGDEAAVDKWESKRDEIARQNKSFAYVEKLEKKGE